MGLWHSLLRSSSETAYQHSAGTGGVVGKDLIPAHTELQDSGDRQLGKGTHNPNSMGYNGASVNGGGWGTAVEKGASQVEPTQPNAAKPGKGSGRSHWLSELQHTKEDDSVGSERGREPDHKGGRRAGIVL